MSEENIWTIHLHRRFENENENENENEKAISKDCKEFSRVYELK